MKLPEQLQVSFGSSTESKTLSNRSYTYEAFLNPPRPQSEVSSSEAAIVLIFLDEKLLFRRIYSEAIARFPSESMQVRVGQRFSYDDGRQGHRGVKAEVIALTDKGFVAQFEDRYDTTTIAWDDPEWMRYIIFEQ